MSLDNLEATAKGIDAGAAAPGATDQGAGPGAASQPPPEKVPTAEQLKPLMKMAIEKGAVKCPSILTVWDDEKIDSFCDALGPVLDKYDMDGFAFFELYRVELVAAFICVPLLWLTAKAIRADLETDEQKKEKVINPLDGGVGYDPHKPPTRGTNADGVPKS